MSQLKPTRHHPQSRKHHSNTLARSLSHLEPASFISAKLTASLHPVPGTWQLFTEMLLRHTTDLLRTRVKQSRTRITALTSEAIQPCSRTCPIQLRYVSYISYLLRTYSNCVVEHDLRWISLSSFKFSHRKTLTASWSAMHAGGTSKEFSRLPSE